ncbi:MULTISPECIES: MogA/MoaB family molybdenum cofactor biosynthesis protein [Atopobiaceae]|uniref:Molybdopterin adenylyltransferase n=1 Tax=Parafannyhessea umbonata TaxID=604330 RepID=A0A1H9QRE0_9ACTN|nr:MULTISPECIES: MogA/MoaB family molybdenum cofactor biosynthesis protein [Atopobiaceae]SEH44109.1 molybdopterin adenylyltransferase [Parafannyhessea umbonata]SER63014.1 molybdopterin adenylyltransferase [Parafannyhessea umbonata]SJZ59257.1 molybdopterin adenylyltransferase [Olsenella sp. KH1P3]
MDKDKIVEKGAIHAHHAHHASDAHDAPVRVAEVITVSDRCSSGEREDASGPALVEYLEGQGYEVRRLSVVPDERDQIEWALQEAVGRDCALVLTTGGTGFSPRDVTPEATMAVCERMVPGIPEAMRAASMEITPLGCLSREACGICGSTLIINLPGSPKAALENLSAVVGPVAHGLRILRDGPADCGRA